jgi:hypothetical protein
VTTDLAPSESDAYRPASDRDRTRHERRTAWRSVGPALPSGSSAPEGMKTAPPMGREAHPRPKREGRLDVRV